MGAHYPAAEWVAWRPRDSEGRLAFWPGACQPVAAVLHIMAGYASTARRWADEGHSGASWHFTVDREGRVMQHLELDDAGYHAGIPASAPAPTWLLWRGDAENINHYTVGIEHEGFPGEPFSEAQSAASRELCRWLATTLGFPFYRGYFPSHAEIDVVNRPNDFNTPELREQHYRYLFEESVMTREEIEKLNAVYEALVGRGNEPAGGELLARWNAVGNSLLLGYMIEQETVADLGSRVDGDSPTRTEARRPDVSRARDILQ